MHKSVDFLHRALQGAWQRNSAIVSNIANVNVPGYKRRDVNFQDALRTEMDIMTLRTTHENHIKTQSFHMPGEIVQGGNRYRVDGGNVDINVENAELAKNSIYFQLLIDEVNAQFQRVKTAMKLNK